MTGGAGLLVGLALGLAQPQLRGPALSRQVEAEALRSAAVALDLQARVERTYQHGSGWEFRVWIEGFETLAAAQSAAQRLAERTGQGLLIVDEENPGHRTLPPELSELPSSYEIRTRMLRALGGPSGALETLEGAEEVELVYTRTLGERGEPIRHHYARAKGREALTVDLGAAGGRGGWRLVSGPSGSWLQKREELVGVSSAGAGRLFRGARPEDVFGASLGLPERLLRDDDFQRLEVVGQQIVDRRNAILLKSVSRHGQLEVLVDAQTWRPHSISYWEDAGHTQRLFLGWRLVESQLLVPTTMETRNEGELLERIHLDKLSLRPLFSEEDFSVKEIP